jgi:hypothetical protein
MSKITLAILTAAAFLYALWLVIFRRELPRPSECRGLKRRFVLAALLFAGLLSMVSCRDSHPPYQPTCYLAIPEEVEEIQTTNIPSQNIAITLKTVWRTLDPKQSDDFRKKLEAAVSKGEIDKNAANILSLAFSEIAFHKQRTRGTDKMVTCYRMTPMGGALATSRENALKQIELLEKARTAGTITEETAGKALAGLAKEIEMLSLAKNLTGSDWDAQKALCEQYNNDKIEPGDPAKQAAELIVEMEEK